MKKCLLTLLGLFLLGAMQASHAAIDECVNANPASVSDVQRCISKIPVVAAATGMAAQGAGGCSFAKLGIAEGQGHRDRNSPTIPTCRVIGDALNALNGQLPDWYSCIDYDGSQQKLNKCLPVYLPKHDANQHREATCNGIWWQVAPTINNSSDVLRGAKPPITCDMINQALQANGWKMIASECLHYKPDDERHLERCMSQAIADLRQRGQPKPNCDGGRRIHADLLRTANLENPKDYVVPPCSTMDSVITRIFDQGTAAPSTTQAQQPQNLPPQIQREVPPTAGPASYPAPQRGHTQSTSAMQPGATPASQSTATQESRDQRRERKYNERMAEVQSGAETVNQVMGAFGVSSGVSTPEQQQNPASASPPPAGPETETQRKTREAGEKVNDAAETVKAVKGMFDMFTK